MWEIPCSTPVSYTHLDVYKRQDKELFNDLYRMYIKDENKLGIHEYFLRVNPAAFQACLLYTSYAGPGILDAGSRTRTRRPRQSG